MKLNLKKKTLEFLSLFSSSSQPRLDYVSNLHDSFTQQKNNVPFARHTFISSFAPLTFVRQQFYGPVLPHASKFCLRPDKIPVYSKIVLVIATTERKCWVVQQNEIPFFFSFNLMCSSCIKNQPPTREEVACFFVLFMYWWLFHSS